MQLHITGARRVQERRGVMVMQLIDPDVGG
jgi:hypothetical protein